MVDPETEVAYDGTTSEESKLYYKTLNEMMKAGLMDREFAAMNYDQYIAKLSSGTVLATMDQQWSMNSANTRPCRPRQV